MSSRIGGGRVGSKTSSHPQASLCLLDVKLHFLGRGLFSWWGDELRRLLKLALTSSAFTR